MSNNKNRNTASQDTELTTEEVVDPKVITEPTIKPIPTPEVKQTLTHQCQFTVRSTTTSIKLPTLEVNGKQIDVNTILKLEGTGLVAEETISAAKRWSEQHKKAVASLKLTGSKVSQYNEVDIEEFFSNIVGKENIAYLKIEINSKDNKIVFYPISKVKSFNSKCKGFIRYEPSKYVVTESTK